MDHILEIGRIVRYDVNDPFDDIPIARDSDKARDS